MKTLSTVLMSTILTTLACGESRTAHTLESETSQLEETKVEVKKSTRLLSDDFLTQYEFAGSIKKNGAIVVYLKAVTATSDSKILAIENFSQRIPQTPYVLKSTHANFVRLRNVYNNKLLDLTVENFQELQQDNDVAQLSISTVFQGKLSKDLVNDLQRNGKDKPIDARMISVQRIFKSGDKLLELNGIKIQNLSDDTLSKEVMSSKTLNFLVLREEKMVKIELSVR